MRIFRLEISQRKVRETFNDWNDKKKLVPGMKKPVAPIVLVKKKKEFTNGDLMNLKTVAIEFTYLYSTSAVHYFPKESYKYYF